MKKVLGILIMLTASLVADCSGNKSMSDIMSESLENGARYEFIVKTDKKICGLLFKGSFQINKNSFKTISDKRKKCSNGRYNI